MVDNERALKKRKRILDMTENELKIKNYNYQARTFWVQAIASFATGIMALFTLFTLLEMKTERDNAYRPDIVITPSIFEGGLDKEDFKNYIYINYSDKDPAIYPVDREMENARFVYLEKPYLTLKNIGQGAAKNVKVTFSTDWISSALEALNSNPSDEYTFFVDAIEFGDPSYNFIDYSIPSEPDSHYFLSTDEETINSITYIAPDEESVNVVIPDNWCYLLAAFYNQGFRLDGPSQRPYMGSEIELDIPDLVITIEYSDIQGKKYKDKGITVPWTGHFTFMKTSADLDAEIESMHLWTGFYEDYVK